MLKLQNVSIIVDGDDIELYTKDDKVASTHMSDGMIAGTIDGEGEDLYLSDYSLEEALTKLLA